MQFLTSPFSRHQRGVLTALAILWFVAVFYFYKWWFSPAHVVDLFRFWIITVCLFWITFLPAYFIFFVLRARIANPKLDTPVGWRVAMVVTKAPSEPAALVIETLKGMLSQKYPHDTWLADEDPSPELLNWCDRNQVKVSSRKDVAEYHQPEWPRRTRCKEGNLAYFYDNYGYENYDFVIQMDADHIPQDRYLEEMLRPFIDPKVGYVSAPSICDLNARESWPARARIYAETNFHGLQQAGHTNGFAPLCIGSHYAVRTTALKQIGGLGPELAEDHSTTLMMNAAGWQGVHALHAQARGFGPQNFPDFAIQEFQWARSLMTILLRYTPKFWRELTWRKKIQFAFCQLWYPLFSFSLFVFFLLPGIALYTATPWVRVIYLEFLLYAFFMILPVVLISSYFVRIGLGRPKAAKVISWEGTIFHFARWPWCMLGCLTAVVDYLKQRQSRFKVTSKPGEPGSSTSTPLKFSFPYLALSVLSILPVLIINDTSAVPGYVIFCVINALIYGLIFALIAFPLKATAVEKGLCTGRGVWNE
jgi:cellulose synthase (UDP-forming)